MDQLKIRVTVTKPDGTVVTTYLMDHNDQAQRRRLGESCANAFAAGLSVSTVPISGRA